MALIDIGAMVTTVSQAFFEQLVPNPVLHTLEELNLSVKGEYDKEGPYIGEHLAKLVYFRDDQIAHENRQRGRLTSGRRRTVTLEGLRSTWHHWNGKETGNNKCLQESRISIKMVMADERSAVDRLSVCGRGEITLGGAPPVDVVYSVETSNEGGLHLKKRLFASIAVAS
ncbi:hypothetical protein DPMN_050549 [Dreissena polymorpha]|uniref:Uncharacterized protein n=1 Tax=Dreissena polymorpha TaxID=45954 RepID=A0A9D4CHE7_DREPO|nr:hypothetical protein DPMN_050549 [Dreissena polymorpha]